MDDAHPAAALLKALRFAADKHRDQRRKGAEASPYIYHPIEVAEILTRAGITDVVTLQGAILHDTIEDTETTPDELEAVFGPEVRRLVKEVTDDKSLPNEVRKQRQVEQAPHLSERARCVKIADKISNVRGVMHHPPANWSIARRHDELAWTERVVAGCRGCHAQLEQLYDETLRAAKEALGPLLA